LQRFFIAMHVHRYDKMSARELFRQWGVSQRCYEEFLRWVVERADNGDGHRSWSRAAAKGAASANTSARWCQQKRFAWAFVELVDGSQYPTLPALICCTIAMFIS